MTIVLFLSDLKVHSRLQTVAKHLSVLPLAQGHFEHVQNFLTRGKEKTLLANICWMSDNRLANNCDLERALTRTQHSLPLQILHRSVGWALKSLPELTNVVCIWTSVSVYCKLPAGCKTAAWFQEGHPGGGDETKQLALRGVWTLYMMEIRSP